MSGRAVSSGVVLAMAGLPGLALAQATGPQYLELLNAAQKQVERVKARPVAPAGAAAARVVLGLEHRPLRPGESWSVEFHPAAPVQVRMSASPEDLAAGQAKPLLFDFKVDSIAAGEARVAVRQRLASGAKPADPRVDFVVLALNPAFVILRKEVHYRDGRATAIVATNGRYNLATGFDAYPLDLPDLAGPDGQAPSEIPPELSGRGDFDAKKALEFNQSDLYGRSVRSIWRDGDPWPVYVKSPAGVAVVLR